MTEQQIDHSISLEIHANSDDYSLYSRVHELECDKAEAECKLATALEHIESLINELFLRGIDVESNDEAIAAKAFFDQALAQAEQPQKEGKQ